MMRCYVPVFLFFIVMFVSGQCVAEEVAPTKSGSGDMRSCEDALDSLQLSSVDANNKAGSANRKFIEVDHCVNHPDDHAIKNQFDDCDNLKWEYQNEMNDVDIELRNIEVQLKNVQVACGYDFVLTVSGTN